MEPKIPKGSVVINQWVDQKNLKVDDIITYQHFSDGKIIYITHRIVNIDKINPLWRFETKGDANPVSDFDLVTQANTEGKVVLMIPLIGYLIDFFKTPVGFILLIALPLLIFIIRQTRDLLHLWPKKIFPITKKTKSRKTLTIIFIAFSFLTAQISFVTYASFTSGQSTISGVTLSTAASFESGPQSGDVVINEVMWMGSTASIADEWIELRNTTGNSIDLTGWKIENAGTSSDNITLSGTIPASGYFLLSNYPTNNSAISNSISSDQVTTSLNLDNGGEQLTLKSDLNITIDQTPSGNWTQGVNGSPDWKSMERNNTPGDGTSSGSWHTCRTDACHSTIYWDNDDHNWGTPKATNLSENDSTSPDYIAPTVSPAPTPSPVETAMPTVTLAPVIDINLSSNHANHKINLKIANLDSSFDYEILYTGNDLEKGITGRINPDEIKDSKYSKDFYLGTCSSGGSCTPEIVEIGSVITVNLMGGQTLTKAFSY